MKTTNDRRPLTMVGGLLLKGFLQSQASSEKETSLVSNENGGDNLGASTPLSPTTNVTLSEFTPMHIGEEGREGAERNL